MVRNDKQINRVFERALSDLENHEAVKQVTIRAGVFRASQKKGLKIVTYNPQDLTFKVSLISHGMGRNGRVRITDNSRAMEVRDYIDELSRKYFS